MLPGPARRQVALLVVVAALAGCAGDNQVGGATPSELHSLERLTVGGDSEESRVEPRFSRVGS